MIANKNLLFVTLSVILILTAFVGTAAAQREYHLDHEWAKIWVNQNGSIDLLYDISITLDSGPNINYVYVGQPKRDFTIGTAVDQYGNTLETSDASSGSDYKVQINLHEPLMAGQTLRFNVTTNVARMIYEDTAENVGMKFTPTWWEEASVSDLQVQIVLPPEVKVENVTTTDEIWDGTPLEGDRLSVFWQSANLLPNQKYTFSVSFPKEFVQEYTSGIYILPDGSIDPPTENISTVDYFTYTFVGNIYDSIVVERDNIVVDGAGYTLQGASGIGIDVTARSNVTIKNLKIEEFGYGIYLNHSANSNIKGNTLTAIGFECIRLYESPNNGIVENTIILNDVDGITLYGSSNNKIAENYLRKNYDGIRLYESSNNSITENTVVENYYGISLASSSNNNITNNSAASNQGTGITLDWSSNNNTVFANTVTNNSLYGIMLEESSNNTIGANNITNNYTGLWLLHCSDNRIIGNDLMNNQLEGIGLANSTNNIIDTNLVLNNGNGISLTRSDNNIVDNNPIVNNTQGIILDSSHNNTLSGQHISINKQYGIYLCDSSNNTIYDILFINNTQQVYDYSWDNPTTPSSINIWDDGVGEGNYWSNYEERYPNATYHWYNGTAIWDTPYVIDENNQDNYPMVPEFPLFIILPLFMITTLLAVIVCRREYAQ